MQSLPSLKDSLILELNLLFSNFLWNGKRHNMTLFDIALKLVWLQKYSKGSSKWTISPNISIKMGFSDSGQIKRKLKYTQFRTLHRRFYTNDKIHTMG